MFDPLGGLGTCPSLRRCRDSKDLASEEKIHRGTLDPTHFSGTPMTDSAVAGHRGSLHIQIPRLQRVLLDKLPPWLDLVAHQDAEEIVGGADVLDFHLRQPAFR